MTINRLMLIAAAALLVAAVVLRLGNMLPEAIGRRDGAGAHGMMAPARQDAESREQCGFGWSQDGHWRGALWRSSSPR